MPLLDVPYREVTIEGVSECKSSPYCPCYTEGPVPCGQKRHQAPGGDPDWHALSAGAPSWLRHGGVLSLPQGESVKMLSPCNDLWQGSDVMTECPECHYPMCGNCDEEASDHEEECRLLRRISSSTPDSRPVILSVVRTLLVRRRGGEQWRSIGEHTLITREFQVKD